MFGSSDSHAQEDGDVQLELQSSDDHGAAITTALQHAGKVLSRLALLVCLPGLLPQHACMQCTTTAYTRDDIGRLRRRAHGSGHRSSQGAQIRCL